MMVALLLMTSCTADDVVRKTTSEEAIPISFSCNYDNEEKNITRAGHQGLMNIEDLYATGFGVMASLTAGTEAPYDNKPNMMYNQKVEFTFVGDMVNPLKGYWSYQPVKYWPADMNHFFISAYAPYVEPSSLASLTADDTGIIGLSTNTEEPYVEYRRCENPQSCVDLLWYYASPTKIPEGTASQAEGTLNMKMHHALARLEITIALTSDPGTTKVLIEEIRLTGKMAKTGRLHLYEQTTITEGEEPNVVTKYYPIWSDWTYDKDDGDNDINHTILIDNDDNNTASYGIIDSQVRYIEGLPYAWQPAGLTTTAQNALSTGDRQTYIYLIPQENWSVTVQVKYKKLMDGQPVPESSTKSVTTEANPLKGNTPYVLNITLSDI